MSEESIEKWIKKLSSLDPGEKESASEVIAILAPVRTAEIIQYDGLPPLIACLKDDSDNVRKNAILAISCIVAKGEGAVVVKSGALEHLVNCLTDKNALVREKTAWAFKELAGVGEVEAIIRSGALRNLVTSLTDTNPEARRWSVATMGRIAERGWAKVIVQCGGVEKLIKCLKDDDSKIRSESAGAIGLIAKHGEAKNIIETDALMELVNCLSDKSTDVREDAVRAISEFAEAGEVEAIVLAGALGPLIGCLSDKSEYVRRYAALTIAKIAESEWSKSLANMGAASALANCLADESEFVRESAIRALRSLGAIDELRKLLNDERKIKIWNELTGKFETITLGEFVGQIIEMMGVEKDTNAKINDTKIELENTSARIVRFESAGFDVREAKRIFQDAERKLKERDVEGCNALLEEERKILAKLEQDIKPKIDIRFEGIDELKRNISTNGRIYLENIGNVNLSDILCEIKPREKECLVVRWNMNKIPKLEVNKETSLEFSIIAEESGIYTIFVLLTYKDACNNREHKQEIPWNIKVSEPFPKEPKEWAEALSKIDVEKVNTYTPIVEYIMSIEPEQLSSFIGAIISNEETAEKFIEIARRINALNNKKYFSGEGTRTQPLYLKDFYGGLYSIAYMLCNGEVWVLDINCQYITQPIEMYNEKAEAYGLSKIKIRSKKEGDYRKYYLSTFTEKG